MSINKAFSEPWQGDVRLMGSYRKIQQEKMLPTPLCWALHQPQAEVLTKTSTKW